SPSTVRRGLKEIGEKASIRLGVDGRGALPAIGAWPALKAELVVRTVQAALDARYCSTGGKFLAAAGAVAMKLGDGVIAARLAGTALVACGLAVGVAAWSMHQGVGNQPGTRGGAEGEPQARLVRAAAPAHRYERILREDVAPRAVAALEEIGGHASLR